MYLWLIIATFITAIYALSSPLRQDIKQLYVEPQAQNVVTKLYVQHRAARKLLANHLSDGEGKTPSYKPGPVTEDMLKGYVPYGFNKESGTARFTTLVYCLDKNSETVSTLPASCLNPSGGGGGGGTEPEPETVSNCCAVPEARTYLVSFGCLPMKWRDVRTGKPSGDLLAAMKTTLGFMNGMGYVVSRSEVDLPDENSEGHVVIEHVGLEPIKTTMGIMGQGNRYYTPIPQYIISENLQGAGSTSFNRVCGDKRHQQEYNPEEDEETDTSALKFYDSCDYCLIYITSF